MMLWPQSVIPVTGIMLSKIHSPISSLSGWGVPGIYSANFVLVGTVLLGFPELEPLFFFLMQFPPFPHLVKGFFAIWFCSLGFFWLLYENWRHHKSSPGTPIDIFIQCWGTGSMLHPYLARYPLIKLFASLCLFEETGRLCEGCLVRDISVVGRGVIASWKTRHYCSFFPSY